jgi:SAM-dependent methyltransferase
MAASSAPRSSRRAGLSEVQRADVLARFYDLDVLDVSYDAELYLALAHQAGGDVLELAVGSGRLAIPLALAGHRVVGVDHDPAMLSRAAARWDEVRGPIAPDRLSLHEADFTAFRAEERFSLAFIAVNTFLLAEDDGARLALLTAMREQLAPGGLAVVEVSTPHDEELAGFDGRLQLEWLRQDPERGDLVTKLISARHDPEASSVELTQVFEWTPPHGGPLSRVLRTETLHLVPASQLASLAREAGFEGVEVRGDHLSIPYGTASHRAILMARLL